MLAGSRCDIERPPFLRQLDVLVNQFGKPFTPIRGDIEIVEEGEFFFGLGTHQLLITEDRREAPGRKATSTSTRSCYSPCRLWVYHSRNIFFREAFPANNSSHLSPLRRYERSDTLCRNPNVSSTVSPHCGDAAAPARAPFQLRPCSRLSTPATPRLISALAPDKSWPASEEINLPAFRLVGRSQPPRPLAPSPAGRRDRCLPKPECKAGAQ